MPHDLFSASPADHTPLAIAAGAMLLPRFAEAGSGELYAALSGIESRASFRCMITPGGFRMSAAMTNCGEYGWVSDADGYRYARCDPETGARWPAMPACFSALAATAASAAGFGDFAPDVCLINRYQPRSKLSLHQDKDEQDFSQPIVSVSLGLPATFLFGGARRRDPCLHVPLVHGDVVVWGGPARRHYHGVAIIADGEHPLTGRTRINLTFRKAR